MARPLVVLGIVLAVPTPVLAQRVTELRMGEASGEPGEVVELSVTASFTHPVYWFDIALNWDPERLSFLGWTAEGTQSDGSDPLWRHWMEWWPGGGLFGFGSPESGPSAREAFQIPAGDEILLAKVRFQLLATAPPGDGRVTPVAFLGEPLPAGGPGRTLFGLVIEEYL